jgi:hypothetical protein
MIDPSAMLVNHDRLLTFPVKPTFGGGPPASYLRQRAPEADWLWRFAAFDAKLAESSRFVLENVMSAYRERGA